MLCSFLSESYDRELTDEENLILESAYASETERLETLANETLLDFGGSHSIFHSCFDRQDADHRTGNDGGTIDQG